MGTSLVPRRIGANAGYVIPKNLRRREELKFVEKLWVYQPPLWFFGGFGISGLATYSVVQSGDSVAGVTGIIAGLITALAGGIAWIGQGETNSGTTGFQDTKNKILLDRSRVQAPHADERKKRKADVKYVQYSVKAYQDGTSVKFYLIEHKNPGVFWYWNTHEKTKKGFWEEGGPVAELQSPTLESLQIELAKWYDTAAELERNAYQTALKKMEVKKLVLELN